MQYGDHRPFAAVTLIRTWRDKACDRATRRNIANPSDLLQDQLFDWLDTSEVAGEASNIRDVALLYGKLVKHDLFSYASYIQRLVARGEVGLSYAEVLLSRPVFESLLISSFIRMLVLVIASFSAGYHWAILLCRSRISGKSPYMAQEHGKHQKILSNGICVRKFERYFLIYLKV